MICDFGVRFVGHVTRPATRDGVFGLTRGDLDLFEVDPQVDTVASTRLSSARADERASRSAAAAANGETRRCAALGCRVGRCAASVRSAYRSVLGQA